MHSGHENDSRIAANAEEHDMRYSVLSGQWRCAKCGRVERRCAGLVRPMGVCWPKFARQLALIVLLATAVAVWAAAQWGPR